MYNPISEKNLKKFKPKWHHGETRTIRVPVVLAEEVLELAHQLDRGEMQTVTDGEAVRLKEALKEVIAKVEAGEKGYKNNSAGQLIKSLKALID